jgi:mono/diheme cytochrome c family protein
VPAGTIPGWDSATTTMYAETEQEIREWILYGAPRRHASAKQRVESDYLVPMPAYEEYLSREDLDDLVAYFQAVSFWSPDIPEAAFEGRKLAAQIGCFGCHGPSGMGGVRNPGSFKGHIPPWDGKEFDELVRDERELREWIMDGRPRRLADNPVARYFLERQETPMPAYREHLSDVELNNLVAYIRWLRKR